MKSFLTTVCLLLLSTSTATSSGFAEGYDPLAIGNATVERKDAIVKDAKRSREIPIRVYLPRQKSLAAVVLFSHGLGGSRAGCQYLGEHWAARGYVAVFLQHPGSDDSVWKSKPRNDRMDSLRKAASFENFSLRVLDVPAVLDQLELWNKTDSHFLAGRLDMKRIGMSGHSFGAVTTQAVSGQAFPIGKGFTDPRIKAAVLMSPSPPKRGDPNRAFGSVKIPWLSLTGTKDNSPIGDVDAKARQTVFPALSSGDKYELVLDKAEHSAFGDTRLPGESERRNPNHHQAVLAVTTAFWDAYLRDDAEARKWLAGDRVKSVLEKDDHWRKK